MILNDWVMEPAVVKTVSNFNVSEVNEILASPEWIKLSFLQAKSNIDAKAHTNIEKTREKERGDDKGRFIPPNLS